MTNTLKFTREAQTATAVQNLLDAFGYVEADETEIIFDYDVDNSSEYVDVNLNLYTRYDDGEKRYSGTERILTWNGEEPSDEDYKTLVRKAHKLGKQAIQDAYEYLDDNY